VALTVLGLMETRFSLKSLTMMYEVQGTSAEEMVAAVNGALEEDRRIMQTVQIGRSDGHYRVQFTVDGTQREHNTLLARLRQVPQFDRVESLGVTDHE
jgi:hypothetical protein